MLIFDPKKTLALTVLTFTFFAFNPTPVLAQIVVKPSQVGIGSSQTFSIGVPSKKDLSTVAVKLLIPDSLNHVTPNIKPGWKIDIKRNGEGSDAKITEISWTGGSIPTGQRDEFLFSAQVPSAETNITWQAYQTYQNGEVIGWDQNPIVSIHKDQNSDNQDKNTPYSQTRVIDERKNPATAMQPMESTGSNQKSSITYALFAFVFSLLALGMQLRKAK